MWWCSLFCFRPEKTLLGKSGPTNQNCQFRLKFATRTNSNMRNSMIMFTSSVFDHKYPFRLNLVQIFKIVCSKWNLIQRLIWICKIQWWCLFYVLHWKKQPVLGNLVQKIKIVTLSWKLVLRLIRTGRIQWWWLLFLFLTGSILFSKFVPKIKTVRWSWHLEPTLIWICRIQY